MADCPKCGKSNPAGMPMCGNCGQSLPPETVPDETAAAADQPANELDDEVLELLQSGQKISAIKLHRERTGVGLKEAKDAVEALATQHGVVPKPTGCAGVVLAAILVGGGLAAWVC